ncbi:MAG TPA: creatininase family protein [Pirellulaceae bacterium]|nr:creatininase family protein [Pirellulaceae bacterium]
MNALSDYIPRSVNTGSWLTAYTLNELKARISDQRIVLPICSLGTSFEELACLGEFVLPPLYHEALDAKLKHEIISRIQRCFPYYEEAREASRCSAVVDVVEMPRARHVPPLQSRILGFSVDTAVEQHGPHLPLATDTIQSYLALGRLAEEVDGFFVGPPVEYGHLTWGLPFGMSIDITPALLTRYVTGLANAVQAWLQPEAMYVVIKHVEAHSFNGIVGDVRNYYNVDAPTMLARMLEVARADLKKLAGV